MKTREIRLSGIFIGILFVLAFLIGPVTADTMTTLNCQNLPGGDYKSIAVSSASECSDACLNDNQCLAATFVHALGQTPSCWMKNTVPTAIPAQCDFQLTMHSFVKQKTISCLEIIGSKADFTASPIQGPAPLTVTFTSTSVGANQYLWTFDDAGKSSTVQNPTNTYTTLGRHDVVLTITTKCGTEFSKTVSIYVDPPTTTPVVPVTGSLEITTTPDGAAVYLDGGSQGKTPLTISKVTTGGHALKITRDGYTDFQQTITVSAGKETQVTLTLTKTGGTTKPTTIVTTNSSGTTGEISITSSPSGASVNLDGWDKGQTPTTIKQVKAGSHTLTLTLAGYEDYTKTVPVEGGKTTSVKAPLTAKGSPPASGLGTLSIRSTPSGANVYIDGEKIGTAPLMVKNVKAGSHKILLTMPDYDDISRTVDISDGMDKEMDLVFVSETTAPGFEAVFAIAACCVVLLLGRKKK
jgi:PKD repeat protein